MIHINVPSVPTKVGFVLICPGKFEERAGRPCDGQTGVTLEVGIKELRSRCPDLFPYTDRYDYLITNAWADVEYVAKTGRSVPSKAEICDAANLRRLYSEIKEVPNLIVCGQRAQEAVRRCVELLGYSGSIANVRHTSRRALGCPTNELLPKVMKDWAENALAQLGETSTF